MQIYASPAAPVRSADVPLGHLDGHMVGRVYGQHEWTEEGGISIPVPCTINRWFEVLRVRRSCLRPRCVARIVASVHILALFILCFLIVVFLPLAFADATASDDTSSISGASP